MKHFIFLTALLFSCLLIQAQDIDILSNVKIEMRDGVLLNATVYKPHEQTGALPLIFQLTPYVGDNYHDRGVYFAKHGFVYANVDTRGRGSSEGVFDPLNQEAKDGYDVVEWFASQPYCNGKVTMWGGSYAGYTQWAAAKELPPHLKTIVPTAAVKPGVDFPISKNMFSSYSIQWLTFTGGKTFNLRLFADLGYWNTKFLERYNQDLPFSKLDSLAGNPDKNFQNWVVNHPVYDEYWRNMSPTKAQYREMTIPILTITGMYDADQRGALTYYKEFIQHASPTAIDSHYLIIGPWDHAGTRAPQKEVGGLIFGDASLLDMNDLHRQWYNYTLKDGIKPEFLKNKVAYYVTGKEQWKYAATLDEIGNKKEKFYLMAPEGQTQDVLNSGKLQRELPVSENPAEYIYDPLDKTYGMRELTPVENIFTDQSDAWYYTDNAVIYHSAPFEKETEVSGFFELKAYIETDVKDVDIEADIYEISPDGNSVLLTGDIIRARYRESLEKEKLLVPGEINLFHFNDFAFASRWVEKGSRLRLIIGSPNSIQYQKNYCSGGVVALETANNAHTAHIKIYNDSKYPSVLMMPVMED